MTIKQWQRRRVLWIGVVLTLMAFMTILAHGYLQLLLSGEVTYFFPMPGKCERIAGICVAILVFLRGVLFVRNGALRPSGPFPFWWLVRVVTVGRGTLYVTCAVWGLADGFGWVALVGWLDGTVVFHLALTEWLSVLFKKCPEFYIRSPRRGLRGLLGTLSFGVLDPLPAEVATVWGKQILWRPLPI